VLLRQLATLTNVLLYKAYQLTRFKVRGHTDEPWNLPMTEIRVLTEHKRDVRHRTYQNFTSLSQVQQLDMQFAEFLSMKF